MRRSASEIIRNLESRIARLEKSAYNPKTYRLASTRNLEVELDRRVMRVVEPIMASSLEDNYPEIHVSNIEVLEEAEMNVNISSFNFNPNDDECYVEIFALVHFTNEDGTQKLEEFKWSVDIEPDDLDFDRDGEPTTKSVLKAIEKEAKDLILD